MCFNAFVSHFHHTRIAINNQFSISESGLHVCMSQWHACDCANLFPYFIHSFILQCSSIVYQMNRRVLFKRAHCVRRKKWCSPSDTVSVAIRCTLRWKMQNTTTLAQKFACCVANVLIGELLTAYVKHHVSLAHSLLYFLAMVSKMFFICLLVARECYAITFETVKSPGHFFQLFSYNSHDWLIDGQLNVCLYEVAHHTKLNKSFQIGFAIHPLIYFI